MKRYGKWKNRLLGVETNITNWQRKQNQNNNFSAVVPYDLEQQRKESKEFLDDLTTRDQRMMVCGADTGAYRRNQRAAGQRYGSPADHCQKAFVSVCSVEIPADGRTEHGAAVGVRKIDALRTLTTESLAVFIPFRVQEIYHKDGIYYGQNVISKNMIIAKPPPSAQRQTRLFSVCPGAGKSFTAKEEMTNIILTDPNADVIIIDPEREYSPLVKAMQAKSSTFLRPVKTTSMQWI